MTGDLIKKELKRLKTSQHQMAEYLGINKATISKIINNKMMLRQHLQIAIMDFFRKIEGNEAPLPNEKPLFWFEMKSDSMSPIITPGYKIGCLREAPNGNLKNIYKIITKSDELYGRVRIQQDSYSIIPENSIYPIISVKIDTVKDSFIIKEIKLQL